jgi:hypothetical protein
VTDATPWSSSATTATGTTARAVTFTSERAGAKTRSVGGRSCSTMSAWWLGSGVARSKSPVSTMESVSEALASKAALTEGGWLVVSKTSGSTWPADARRSSPALGPPLGWPCSVTRVPSGTDRPSGPTVGGRQAEVGRRLQREARLVEARGLDDAQREAVVRAVVVAAARAQGRVAVVHLEAAAPAALGQRAHRAGALAALALEHEVHAPGIGARDAHVGLEHAAARRHQRAVLGDDVRRAARRDLQREAHVARPAHVLQRPAAEEDVGVRVAHQQQQRHQDQRAGRAPGLRERGPRHEHAPQVLALARRAASSTTLRSSEPSGPPCSCSAETMRPSNSGRARSTTRAASSRPGPRNSGRSTRRASSRTPSTAISTSSARAHAARQHQPAVEAVEQHGHGRRLPHHAREPGAHAQQADAGQHASSRAMHHGQAGAGPGPRGGRVGAAGGRVRRGSCGVRRLSAGRWGDSHRAGTG